MLLPISIDDILAGQYPRVRRAVAPDTVPLPQPIDQPSAGRDASYRFGRDEATPQPVDGPSNFQRVTAAPVAAAADRDFDRLVSAPAPARVAPAAPQSGMRVDPNAHPMSVEFDQPAQSSYPRVAVSDVLPGATPVPQMPDHSQDAPRGVWGNIKHHLEHAGKGALLGLASGGGPGALLGAVTGAVSPHAVDQWEYNAVTYPRYQQRAADQSHLADAAMRRVGEYGQVTGINPLNNESTEPARARLAQEQFNRIKLDEQMDQQQQRNDNTARYQQSETERKTKEGQQREASRRLNTLRHVWEKGGMNDRQRGEFAQLAGLSGALGEAFMSGEAEIKPDERGAMWVTHKRTGTREPVVDPDTGKQMISFAVTQEAGKDRRAAEAQAGADRRAAASQEGADRRATQSQEGADRRQQNALKNRKAKGGGLLGTGGDQNSAPARTLSQADVKAYADRAYNGDVKAARQRIANDHPDWVLP